MSENPIEVKQLVKTYGDFNAVDGLDMVVHRGEVFALLGPNGAGKTTAVEIMVGTRTRTSGEVSILGEDPGKDRRAWRARVGVVPQNTADFAELTVREVVSHFTAFYPNPFDPDELIEMVGLTAKSRSRASSMSGGQRRRLDVAVGMAGRPDVLFLDEPTTGLDPEARRQAWDLVRFFKERNVTTVLTTHYLDEAEALADRAGIIARGRMRQVGTLSELTTLAGHTTQVICDPIDKDEPRLPKELAVPFNDHTGRVSLATDQPTRVVQELASWAKERGHDEVPGLIVKRPTLEDTYLALVSLEKTE
ncbi:ABC transporter ATP-binding protein [Propioniferax innocua]|uniref:ABC-2 type transport system ATP-binding protein n=1 Tax=Propioniferax innocua TaxID=1753 RepID=A0A542ZAG3_9ACTN|nr:ABC transporter ATP-binding protein [Propioniferax innocua]TQL57324.1 ABC-2 type transport system ATP-binding protein [Propioniferax innocua]